jgi:mannitol/fructose-specific phosphotransferase system IIA component (Ntr-type)
MNLARLLRNGRIFIADTFPDTDTFYAEFSLFLSKNNVMKRLFIKRENVQSTAIGKGAAAPHIFSDEFSEFTFCIALLKKGMDFKSPDGNKVYLVFLIMSDERDVGLHLKSLAHIARMVNCTDVVKKVKDAERENQILKAFSEEESLI